MVVTVLGLMLSRYMSTYITGAAEATLAISGKQPMEVLNSFLTSIDEISPPGLTAKILQIACTLLHKIIHIIL